MAVLVDYACGACGGVAECRVASPPPSRLPCPQCGAPAQRRFAPVARVGGAPPPPSPAPAAGLCRQRPDVPLLCHMEPAKAAEWVARRDGRDPPGAPDPASSTPPAAPGPAHAGHHHGGHHHRAGGNDAGAGAAG